ncbi:Gfo/Idh/MocA family oxidoreductase [Paenibacillus sp. IB182496]|uniref:Gfo/Idh/MocA family oxidoreductase n=1 Tax=Paenibacillus sabuli TaxID=2772509 RepID=A0A927BWC4_9BACL|nr:Gfo/Idh/MocA family oxidoreductase [Paenibacillus sabuli]MBD2846850.1 Gfo/Idh/MocA family oxidoreductase [Paenibacillus sabuli]
MKKLRVGVVGVGKVAQIMHLPFLSELPQYELAALCDVSPQLLRAMGERYGVERRYLDYAEMIRAGGLDCIAVLTMDHPGPVLAALEAGIHVLVEKPLCFDPADGRRMVETARRKGVQLMVGYMKRYDPGYAYAAELIREMADMRLLRVHDFAGDFRIGDAMYTLEGASDIPPEVLKEGQARVAASVRAGLGAGYEDLAALYQSFLMLCSHDLAVMRGLLGAPQRVLHSDAPSDKALLALLDYGEGRRCAVEMGMWAGYSWWDEQVVAYGRERIVTIAFKNPYAQYVPTVVQSRHTEHGKPVEARTVASCEEAFRNEWLHFHEVITTGVPLRTPGEDGLADVELALQIVRAAQAKEVSH